MGIATAIAAITALGSLAAAGNQIFGGSRGSSPAPQIAPAPVPKGPPADLTGAGLAGMKPGSVNEPGFLRFSPSMTNLQKRAAFATMATQGTGPGRDPDALGWYKNLALSDYDPVKGLPGGVLPIERQLAENVFGVKPKNDSVESFLSAIVRGT